MARGNKRAIVWGLLEGGRIRNGHVGEKMKPWDIFDLNKDMNVLQYTWAFKCKWLPGSIIQKFMDRFCVRGDQQIKGVEFFETFAPVIQWATILLTMILSLMIVLETARAVIAA